MKIAVIGGGVSGLMVAGELSQYFDVTIIERNEKCGKKLYITGKGRCNLTNACSVSEFLENVVHGEKFLISAINRFTSYDTIDYFEKSGLRLKTERGNRVFPLSDKASDVTKTLLKNADKCQIILNERVLKIEKDENFDKIEYLEKNKNLENLENPFKVTTEKNVFYFDKVIVATGGKSYSSTGSSGDGYKFASSLGIEIVTPESALVPIKIKDKFCSKLEGLSLKNVKLKAVIGGKKREFFGEILFTYDAISGPISLSMSSYIGNKKVEKLSIDLKPALTEEQLNLRLLKEFKENSNKDISNVMKNLLPHRLIEIFLEKAQIKSDIKANSITKEMREKIIKLLKDFVLEYDKLYDIEAGIITSGGVDLKEINPKTMESKKVNGLYFIGEVLDIDCLTGGFNLQAAFSTAQACANAIKSEYNKR